MTFNNIFSWELFGIIQHELLLFAAVFFLIGAMDDFAVDLYWLYLRLTKRAKSETIDSDEISQRPLTGGAAIFIPAWDESEVIADTIKHMLASWPQKSLRLYIGCYRNDPKTIEAAMAGAGDDSRVRVVIHDRVGPTTKADCLNRLYRALQSDEQRTGILARMVVLHDAEDMVDPAALALLDRGIDDAEFVQLPVLPLPQEKSRWLGSHYCEEFAEAHGKGMVVRNALGAALPAAGVGCAIERQILTRLELKNIIGINSESAPFNAASLTEDYEMGIELSHFDARWSFVRRRHSNGELVATRAYFPARLDHIVAQKTRWVHGIAFQGWDRLGWASGNNHSANLAEVWMRLRDRRGPLTSLVLLAGYALLGLSALGWAASMFGNGYQLTLSPLLQGLLFINFGAFLWRCVMRFTFVAREFGIGEGVRAILRIPVTNIIAIMAGRRALAAYSRSLMGGKIVWDKTPHLAHPARNLQSAIAT